MYSDLEVTIEKVGNYATHPERVINLFHIEMDDMPASCMEIEEIFMQKTGIALAQLGVEGCPGRWYTGRVRAIYIDYIYDYALIEVARCLDV